MGSLCEACREDLSAIRGVSASLLFGGEEAGHNSIPVIL